MGIIPISKVGQLQFCESHWPVWSAATTSIGVTTAQCNAFKALTESNEPRA